MVEDIGIRPLAESLVKSLSAAGKAVATAESCTGGWIAKAITDVRAARPALPTVSSATRTARRNRLLGVQNQTLVDHGAVSDDVVGEMARGVLKLSGADYSVAVSGIAGPDGGTEEKPVGTVWIAWATRGPNAIEVGERVPAVRR